MSRCVTCAERSIASWLNLLWGEKRWLWQSQCAESSRDILFWICAIIWLFYPWRRRGGKSSRLTQKWKRRGETPQWACQQLVEKRADKIKSGLHLWPGQVQKISGMTFVFAEWDLTERGVPIFCFWILWNTTCLGWDNKLTGKHGFYKSWHN